jgi:uncharacterized integral membrane protein
VTPDMLTDHYAALGIEPDASQDEIARAFRALAKELHPDRDSGDAERFREVSAAWEVLGDPVRRLVFDEERVLPARGPLPAAVRAKPVPRWTPARARLALWGGLAIVIAGILVVLVVANLRSDTTAFRASTLSATATVIGDPRDPDIVFRTADGRTIRIPEPERASGGGSGRRFEIRYDPEDPTKVKVDASTVARDITLGIVALKFVVGGLVLAFVGARRLRRPKTTGNALELRAT